MFLPKSDMFKDLRQEAIHDISEIAVEETHPKGTVLFSTGHPATHFYLLVDGKVGLAVGNGPSSHYTVNRIGESFGWSSVVGRGTYSGYRGMPRTHESDEDRSLQLGEGLRRPCTQWAGLLQRPRKSHGGKVARSASHAHV